MFQKGKKCMNSFLLLIPFLAIRFLLLSILSKGAIRRAAYFAPLQGQERVAYFICFTGIALLAQAWILLAVVVVFQISSHWIILSEERWCLDQFGTDYEQYMKEVRRYL